MKRAMNNFHVPLSAELHRRLHAAARRSSRPATALAREAIEHWVSRDERETLATRIAGYAAEHVGTELDLDEPLEAAGIEHLLDLDEAP